MSQENVEIVLASYEWANRERRFARRWWHDGGEYINAREDPDHAVHRGAEEIEKLFASWLEAYPDVTVNPLEARANGQRVFVWVRFVGTAAGSGITLTMELAHVITLEQGKIRRLEECFDRVAGLNAVGLEE